MTAALVERAPSKVLTKVSTRDRTHILRRLHQAGVSEVNSLWKAAGNLSSAEFQAVIIEAFPEIAGQYNTIAADFALDWYDQSAPDLPYRAVRPDPISPEQLKQSAQWALGAYGDDGLKRLAGTLSRAVFGGAREAIVENTRMEPGATWARHASANACAFCAMMATRGSVYSTEGAATLVGSDRWEQYRVTHGRKVGQQQRRRTGRQRGTQKLGDKYHDHCHCIAVEVRPGMFYEPPPYVEQWEDAYIKAAEAAKRGPYGVIDTKGTLAGMRQILGSH